MIAKARKDLREALQGGFPLAQVYSFPPDRLEGPAIIIDTAPIVETGDTYSTYKIGFKIVVIAASAGDTEIEVDNLDAMISRLLATLDTCEISAGSHFIAQGADGQQFLAYELTATTDYRKEIKNEL